MNISFDITAQAFGLLSFLLGIATFYQKRTITAIYISSKWVAAVFIIISVASGIVLADNLSQLWSIAGTVVGTYSIFLLKGIKLRIGFLIGASCWLTNNILIGSIGGTLLEMSAITVNLTTMYRLYRDQKQLINTAI